MKLVERMLVRAMAWCVIVCASGVVGAQSLEVVWHSRTLRGFGDVPIRGEIGTLQLPVRHANPEGPKLELAFVRFRTDHPRPKPTIFFLAGGPGGSGIELSALMATHPQLRLLELADVVGIDQRGTGLSRPNLLEPEFVHELAWDHPATRSDYLASFERCVAECVAHCTQLQVDMGAFNSRESSHDIDVVRQALGLEKVVLFGSSYGSHLGLAYLSEYSHNVDRAVLTKVEGLAQTWKYPHTLQTVLEQLDTNCRQDPYFSTRFESLHATIGQLRDQLRTEPVKVWVQDVNHVEREIVLGEYELLMAVAHWIAETDGMAKLPKRLIQFREGDWQALAEFAKESRRVSIQAMPLFMDCASGASVARREQIERELQDPRFILQDGLMAPFFLEVCRGCGEIDLGDSFRAGTPCSVPILFVSGTLDVRTPPENVEAILANYSQAAHVLVHNAGHDSRELMSIEYRRLFQGFLRGDPVQNTEFTLPRVVFEK
jgi:pimeloyl-ACP methyl ester carboxylesterase